MKNIISNIFVTLFLVLFVCGVFYLSDTGLSFVSPGQLEENTLKSPEIPEPVNDFVSDDMNMHKDVSQSDSGKADDEEEKSSELSEENEKNSREETKKEEPEVTFEDILAETEVSFENTLFIGDSRAEGIAEYADIEGAVFYTASGMSVYNVHKQRRINSLERRVNLETILSEKQYERIYVILGINELGYNYDVTMERYTQLVEQLEQAQPEATIILNANLHVTAKKSQRDVNYNNESLDRMNEGIAKIATERGHEYLDVNPVFDDEENALGDDYTLDDTHILAKYYPMWKEFLTEETRKILAKNAFENLSEEKE